MNPCSFLGSAFNGGNIRALPFVEIWQRSQQFQRMRRATPDGFNGGCRARSLTFAGSVDAADPWFEEFQHGGSCGEIRLHPGANVERLTLPLLPS